MQFVEDSRAAVEDIPGCQQFVVYIFKMYQNVGPNVVMPDEPARALGSEAQLLRQV